jgi:hypothetical protein
MLDPPRGARRAQPTRPAGWSRPSAAERARAAHVRPPGDPGAAEPVPSVEVVETDAEERSSRAEHRRRQRRARLAVGAGLVGAAGLTVLTLLTAGSSPGSVIQTQSSVVPTPGPAAVGTAGLVPVPQSPPTTP